MSADKEYDVVILGAGPAGMTAAIYSARYGLKTLVVGREIGGMANYAHRIENYPGYEGSGSKLMERFYKQARSMGAEFLNDDLIDIKKERGFEVITSRKERIKTKAVIISLGTQRKMLNVKGEDRFLGRGVSYCATCDGRFFRNKAVAVIGAGNSACKAAEFLAGIAKKVYMIARSEKDRCEDILSRKLREKNNFEFIENSIPLEVRGKESVDELVIEIGKNKKGIPKLKGLKVEGVFIEVGSLPVSDVCKELGVKLDREKYISVDKEDMSTNVEGIFAAGDVVKSKLKQIVIAAAQGARAAKSAYDYIQKD